MLCQGLCDKNVALSTTNVTTEANRNEKNMTRVKSQFCSVTNWNHDVQKQWQRQTVERAEQKPTKDKMQGVVHLQKTKKTVHVKKNATKRTNDSQFAPSRSQFCCQNEQMDLHHCQQCSFVTNKTKMFILRQTGVDILNCFV